MLLAILVIPMMISCGDDEEKGSSPSGDDLIIKASGTWMCTQSVDTQNGQAYQGLLVGKEITINPNGTYTSTASTFGYSGTYTVNGNKITAHSDAGGTFLVNVTINGDRMTWDGTASNGVIFRYVFEREGKNTPSEMAFTKEIIAGDFQWCVKSVNMMRGANSQMKEGKTICFREDGSCDAFLSTETAWRINNGRIETYYKQTEEPMYVYTLLSANDDEIKVRIDGTLDDILQAEVVLEKDSFDNTAVVEEDITGNILAIYNSCYLSCVEFETAQLKLEGIRSNPATAHQITPNSEEVHNAWQYAYQTINRINMVLEYEDMIQDRMGEQKGRTLIAELKAMRAFVNYNLAMLWGKVPLLNKFMTENNINIAQTNQSEVFQFALNEISGVIEYLPAAEELENGRSHFNKDAGLMLKAELQMTLGDKTQAAITLNQVNRSSYVANTRATSTSLDRSFIWALNLQTNSFFPVYTLMHNQLYLYEVTGSRDGLMLPFIDINNDGMPDDYEESYWRASDYLDYGFWAALKRMGRAQDVTGCFDYELLMPIPQSAISMNPNMNQNPGY